MVLKEVKYFLIQSDDDQEIYKLEDWRAKQLLWGMYNNDYNDDDLETNEHYPNAGEHYTQFSNAISGTGWWNDLFVPGVTYTPFQTISYVLNLVQIFVSPVISCGNGISLKDSLY